MGDLYWMLRGGYSAKRDVLAGMDRGALERAVIAEHYNTFLARHADYRLVDEDDPHGHGKRLPYIGWYWRDLPWGSPGQIPIGDCGKFIGFMARNKWDYPSRCLTEEEAMAVLQIVDDAMALSQEGGEVSAVDMRTKNKLAELWGYLQSLTITETEVAP